MRRASRAEPDRSAALIAAELAAIVDPSQRRKARLAVREGALRFRVEARRDQSMSRLADSLAKFGGGSLLTATLLLVLGGRAGIAVTAMAALALFLFVAGSILWMRLDRRALVLDHRADRLEAALKETERLT